MKYNYTTYMFLAALVGIEAWFFSKIFPIPFLGYLFDILSFPVLTQLVVAEIDEPSWRFVALFLKDVLLFSFYGLLVAVIIKSASISLKVISSLILLAMMFSGSLITGLEAAWEADCDNKTRYQTPVTRSYITREVTIEGGAPDVRLSGELTLPVGEGPFPGIVLISGSEPTDRNSFILGHSPFLVLADYLTRQGYAVLRHDDRGYGKSTGNTYEALDDDFSKDAAAALKWLRSQKKIDANRVGFVGHSQGAAKAPMAAQIERPDFMIFIAGGLEGVGRLLLRQGRDIAQAGGVPADKLKRMERDLTKVIEIVASSKTPVESKKKLEKFAMSEGVGVVLAKQLSAEYSTPWIVSELTASHNPFEKTDRKISALIKAYEGPILALYGEKDLLVSARLEMPVIKTLLTNSQSRAIVLPGLNHFMQPVPQTKEPRQAVIEACDIETTIAPNALKTIGDWLKVILK